MTSEPRGGTLGGMADDQRQVGFRFPVDLIERLDLYAEQMGRVVPGVKFTRADAVKALLEKGLTEAGLPADDGPRPKKTRR